jgi:hypothetical protein
MVIPVFSTRIGRRWGSVQWGNFDSKQVRGFWGLHISQRDCLMRVKAPGLSIGGERACPAPDHELRIHATEFRNLVRRRDIERLS